MGDHAAPCRNQSQSQKLGADKGSHNSYTPHAKNIIRKGALSVADAQHHAETVSGIKRDINAAPDKQSKQNDV